MAELKWNNINDSGANGALSNYLSANRDFRNAVIGIGDNLSRFALTMQEGDAENNRRIRDEHTQAILNRMGRISTQEDYDKFIASGATDNNALREQYGWAIDMDKINGAQANLAHDVYARATYNNNAKDYNANTLELDAKINEALSKGDTATYTKLLAQRTAIGGRNTSANMASTGYALTKDTFDKSIAGTERVLAAQDNINKSNMEVVLAKQALEDFKARMSAIPNWDDPTSLGYEKYKAQEAQLNQALALAQANQSVAQNALNAWKGAYNMKVESNPADSVIERSKSTSASKEVEKPDSTVEPKTDNARAVLQEPQSNDPATIVAQRAANTAYALAPNAIVTNPNEDVAVKTEDELYDQYLNQVGKDISDKDSSVWGAIKAGQLANQQVTNQQQQTSLDKWKGGDDKSIADVMEMASKYSTWGEFVKHITANPDLVQKFDALNAATGGSLRERLEEHFEYGGSNSLERTTAKESIKTTNQTLKNALEGKYIAEEDGADYKYLGLGVITGDSKTVKAKNGEDITLTSSTADNTKAISAQRLYDLLAQDYKSQGWWDSGKWFESAGLKNSVEEAIKQGADPVAIYSVARKMFDHADGEVSASEFKRNMKKLVEDKDAIRELKSKYHDDVKRIESIQSNHLLNAQLESWLIKNQKNYSTKEEAVLAGYKALGINLDGIVGSRTKTQAQKQKAEASLEAIRKWIYPAESSEDSKNGSISTDIYGNDLSTKFGDNYDDAVANAYRQSQRLERRNKIINGDVSNTSIPKDIQQIYKYGTSEQIEELEQLLKPYKPRNKK